ncbi:stachyose synthase [Medicago truncatula]|uniref:Galactinol-raffinose galactosyltransferase n=1 Tax=Medicago truncatula TaxID=3880 RepID=A0A072VNM2_MEDTR|nr:stachyose synthase [Medicago truncatula]KEH43624.1 galactinol-raffinose galactosyltransferase [Medicago truncatula]
MAPPNHPVNSTALDLVKTESLFDLSEGTFTVKGVPLFHDVPNNVSFSSFSAICKTSESNAPPSLVQRVHAFSHKGGFFGFSHETPSDRLMNSLGSFHGKDFVSVFRFKTWWSSQWIGNSGSDLQMETQWILIDIPEIKSYVVVIPVIEKSFRSALHPGSDDHVMICAESGSTQVKASSFDAIAYVHVSENPYTLMNEAYSAIRVHLNTFRLLEEKTLPNLVDKFGWCTWDAFYLSVGPIGVFHGLDEFLKSGVEPRFVIIDDGWQSISLDGCDPNENAKNLILGGQQMTGRLHRLDEGDKFKKYESGLLLGPNAPTYNPKKFHELISKGIEYEKLVKEKEDSILSKSSDLAEIESNIKKVIREIDDLFGGEQSHSVPKSDKEYGLKAFTRDLRTKFKGLDDIYVWHALCGAWGGVRPETTHLNSKIVQCKLSPGLDGTMEDLAVVNIVKGAIGLVHPDQAIDFYDSMHSYLAESGITGVKVDVMHTLEYVCDEYGGRVDLAKAYYEGLTKSIVKNFNGSGIIASMQQCNDFFFLGTKQVSMGRAGDDFWVNGPEDDPMGAFWLQGLHMIHCSYNSLWMGQMIQPDWDMFQSDHICAKYHAGSRAICGGPIYLSDNVGSHDFDLIKKLVFPDGTIPRCTHFALPTRDCLFKNPLFDQKTVLKIWNFNKYGGVIGAFNCQGSGWDPKVHTFRGFPECYKPITGSVHVTEVEWDQKKEAVHLGKAEEYVVYLNQAEELCLMTPKSEPIKFIIQPSTFELYNFVPVTKLGGSIKFAPIGLANMFNSGGTILDLEYVESCAMIKVKGGGNFLAYSNESPEKCQLNGSEVAFEWLSDGKLSFNVPWIEEAGGVSDLTIFF